MIRIFANSVLAGALFVGSGTTVELLTSSTASAAVKSFYAVVGSGGTLKRTSGAIKANRLKAGSYEVLFGRDVSTCSFTATVGDPTATAPKIPVFGIAVVAPRFENTHGVYVATADLDGHIVDLGFYLNVLCP